MTAPQPHDVPVPRALALRAGAQVLLGVLLGFAGISHLTFARDEFQAQVPPWLPVDPDLTVLMSGIVEIVLGLLLLTTWSRLPRRWLGVVVAAFFVAVLPGNVSQLVHHVDAFGLDSDAARIARLPFQVVLIAWALWSTTAWWAWRHRRRGRDH